MKRLIMNSKILFFVFGAVLFPLHASAQEMGSLISGISEVVGGETLNEGTSSLSGRLIQMVGLMTILSLAPGILVLMTSFTRFVIVFSMLRSALGLNQTPPNMVLSSLALFMTFYVCTCIRSGMAKWFASFDK